jgi:hypothetical protein
LETEPCCWLPDAFLLSTCCGRFEIRSGEFVVAGALVLGAREALVHLGEHELGGSISPPAAQGFAAVMNGESAIGRQYRLVLRGELSDRFAGEFEGMHMERVAGTTVLSGNVVDQTHLYGLLGRLPELGIELVSVAPVGDLTGGGGVE